jgi:serine/threonine protein kinase
MDDPNRTTIEPFDPIIGCVIAKRYRVELKISIGGFGAVYRGTDLETNFDVAIKVLHPHLTANRAVVARFRREGAALAALRSPHTVTAYDVGEADDGWLYIVMELLEGESLHTRKQRRGAMPWRAVVAIARAVCLSLEEAHALGIIHRDLKPANIFLEMRPNESEVVKVLDFGIAKIIRGGTLAEADLTLAGQMIGTFDYMAPEQMVGGECSPPTDIFTLGIVMYEMITGQLPFGDTPTATAMLVAQQNPHRIPMSSHVDVPADLDRIVLRCLQADQENRFASATELGDELARFLEDHADATRNWVAGQSTTSKMEAVPEVYALQPEGEERTVTESGKRFVPSTTLPGVGPPAKRRK